MQGNGMKSVAGEGEDGFLIYLSPVGRGRPRVARSGEGELTIESPIPPHPDPLPTGEREIVPKNVLRVPARSEKKAANQAASKSGFAPWKNQLRLPSATARRWAEKLSCSARSAHQNHLSASRVHMSLSSMSLVALAMRRHSSAFLRNSAKGVGGMAVLRGRQTSDPGRTRDGRESSSHGLKWANRGVDRDGTGAGEGDDKGMSRQLSFTSPRLRGEVGEQSEPGEGTLRLAFVARQPLTPTLSCRSRMFPASAVLKLPNSRTPEFGCKRGEGKTVPKRTWGGPLRGPCMERTNGVH